MSRPRSPVQVLFSARAAQTAACGRRVPSPGRKSVESDQPLIATTAPMRGVEGRREQADAAAQLKELAGTPHPIAFELGARSPGALGERLRRRHERRGA